MIRGQTALSCCRTENIFLTPWAFVAVAGLKRSERAGTRGLGVGGSASFACGAEAQTNHAACRRFAEQLLSASRQYCTNFRAHAQGQALIDPRGMNVMSQVRERWRERERARFVQ